MRVCKGFELKLREEEKELCRLGHPKGLVSEEVIKIINAEEDYASEAKVHGDLNRENIQKHEQNVAKMSKKFAVCCEKFINFPVFRKSSISSFLFLE